MAGCCGDDNAPSPAGKQDGDVLAIFIDVGTRRNQGRVTERLYIRPGNRAKAIWVAPQDVEAMPDVFKAIKPLEAKPEPEVAQPLFGVASLTNQMVQAGWLGRPLAKPSDDVKPDVARVVAFGKAIYDDV